MSKSHGEVMTLIADAHLARKAFHIFAASIIPVVYYFEFIPRPVMLAATIAITAVVVAADVARINLVTVNALFVRAFGAFMKVKESASITGSSYLLMGTALAMLLFSPVIASVAILYNSVGDPVAAVAGKEFGRIRLANGKSLEGAAAMFVTCIVVGFALMGLTPAMMAGALAAAATEFFLGRLDDNLTVPLSAGAVMTLAEFWL